mgnify:CR=1 FL=1
MELTKEDIILLEKVLKVVKEKVSDIFTKYICDDLFSDDRPKKRNYLTDIEVEIKLKIDDILKFIK